MTKTSHKSFTILDCTKTTLTLLYWCEADIRKCNGLLRGILILKHRVLGGEYAWRFCFASLQQFPRPLFIFGTLSDCGWNTACLPHVSHPLVFRRLIDFRSFRLGRSIPRQGRSSDVRKQRKSIKPGHSCCYRLPRSRSCTICKRRQSTLGPLISHCKRNTETRDCGCMIRGAAQPHVPSTQGRAS